MYTQNTSTWFKKNALPYDSWIALGDYNLPIRKYRFDKYSQSFIFKKAQINIILYDFVVPELWDTQLKKEFLFKKRNFLKIDIFLTEKDQKRNGLRFQKLNFHITSLQKKFFFFKKMKNLKNNYYQHKFSRKQLNYPHFLFNSNFLYTFFHCVYIQHCFRKYVGVFRNKLGVFHILPLIQCIKLGSKINLHKSSARFIYSMHVGNVMSLILYDILFAISNVGLNKPKFIVGMGTYGIILKKNLHHVIIQMPSSIVLKFCLSNYAFLGRNAGVHTYKQYFGKASTIYTFNKTLQSRSVAKNPVDHPNGGRTRGKMLFKTPWGLVAKHSK